jgi:hypothetical protein
MPILYFGVNNKVEYFKRFRKEESGLVSILETLVASIVVVISITAAGLIINAGLKIASNAQNTTQAVAYSEQVYLKAATMPYHKLSTITPGANVNTVDLTIGKTDGCKTLENNFAGEPMITTLTDTGLTYCEVKTRGGNSGTEFNIQTNVTRYSKANEASKTVSDLTTASGFEAKLISVEVSWFEGELDELGRPILRTVKSSRIFTPNASECIKPLEGGVACLN